MAVPDVEPKRLKGIFKTQRNTGVSPAARRLLLAPRKKKRWRLTAVVQRQRIKSKPPDWGRVLNLHLLAHGLPSPKPEFKFHPTRKFAFDFAWPDHRVALEVEGGIRSGRSRHTSYAGFTEDAVKYNDAACLGWRVIRVTPAQLTRGDEIRWLSSCLLRGRG